MNPRPGLINKKEYSAFVYYSLVFYLLIGGYHQHSVLFFGALSRRRGGIRCAAGEIILNLFRRFAFGFRKQEVGEQGSTQAENAKQPKSTGSRQSFLNVDKSKIQKFTVTSPIAIAKCKIVDLRTFWQLGNKKTNWRMWQLKRPDLKGH